MSTPPLELPGEVVTRSLLRYVELPGGPGRLALVTLDNGLDHTRPTTLGPAGLRGLAAALDEVERSDAVAVALTGKPHVFAVGADLTGVPLIRSREQALALGRLGHATFRRLGELGRASFAYLNGAVLGGGLELALHCSYRAVSAGVRAVALPECALGMVPGWGGTQLLPALVGAEAAVKVVVENPLEQNRMLSGRTARDLGIADALFEPADFLERSVEWTAQVLRGEVAVDRPLVDRGTAWEVALARGRAVADARVHGAAPAPYRALELLALARAAGRDEGFAAEDEALADLLMSEELRAGLYAFDLVQRRAKRPGGAPPATLARPVTKVGVVGAGLMASQLASLFAQRLEVPVVMTDLDEARATSGVARVHADVQALLEKGRIDRDRANRLMGLVSGSASRDVFADADLVVEAVFEELAVKQGVLQELEEVVTPECVLATNTSALSVTAMAEHLAHPERVLGLHFFNPVAVLPLVEVVRGEKTDDPTLATGFAVGTALRKSCVLVRDAPGFVVNRLLSRLLGAVLRAVDEGTPVEVAEHALDPLGLPMSPFELLALVGPAVALHVAETLHSAFPDRFPVPAQLRDLVEGGRPLTRPGRPLSADAVQARALDALAEECRLVLDAGVVADPRDIDLCLLLGAGWPSHLGGLTPYLDRTGTSVRVTGSRFLLPGVASLPA